MGAGMNILPKIETNTLIFLHTGRTEPEKSVLITKTKRKLHFFHTQIVFLLSLLQTLPQSLYAINKETLIQTYMFRHF
jgi:hypothetical protein